MAKKVFLSVTSLIHGLSSLNEDDEVILFSNHLRGDVLGEAVADEVRITLAMNRVSRDEFQRIVTAANVAKRVSWAEDRGEMRTYGQLRKFLALFDVRVPEIAGSYNYCRASDEIAACNEGLEIHP